MESETTYSKKELTSGKCTCCGEKSDKILIGDGRCVDCIEAEKFYEEIMKDVDRFAKNSPHYDPTEMF